MFEDQLQMSYDPFSHWIYIENGLIAALFLLGLCFLQQAVIYGIHKSNKGKIKDIHRFYAKSMVNEDQKKVTLIKIIGIPVLISIFYVLSFVFQSNIMMPIYIATHVLLIIIVLNETTALIIAGFMVANHKDDHQSLQLKVYKVLILLGALYFAVYFSFYSALIILLSAWITLLGGLFSIIALKMGWKPILNDNA